MKFKKPIRKTYSNPLKKILYYQYQMDLLSRLCIIRFTCQNFLLSAPLTTRVFHHPILRQLTILNIPEYP